MKKLLFFLPLLLLLSNCGDKGGDSNNGGLIVTPGGGTGGGGGTTGNITFETNLVQDEQQNVYFEFKPSNDVSVNQISAVCAAINVNENIPVTNTDIYTNAKPMYLGPVQNVQTGQQWQFTIKGNIGNAQGQTFTSSVNYTVQ